MTAMQAQNVLACGKHFRARDTDTDSHRELPVLKRDLDGTAGA